MCDEPFVFVPNAFTPNGDKENDVLYVRGIWIEKFVLRIFDRWGEKVFQSSEVDNGWDGNFKGKPLPNGNFVYKLSVLTYEDKIINKSGSSTLVR